MFVLHVQGHGVELRREWFDTSHPALAGFTHDSPTGRGRYRWLIRPLTIGDNLHADLELPGVRPAHVLLEQASPGEVRVRAPQPMIELFVDGARVFETLPLPLGAVLRFEGYTLQLERTLPLAATQLARLARLAPGDDQAWRVFADEAEESGHAALAEWMRLERSVTDSSRPQLASVGAPLTPSARATVGTAKILGCNAHSCPGTWNALSVTSEPRFRDCARCRKSVPWCERLRDAEAFVLRGLPAVLDSGERPPTAPWPLMTIG